MSFIKKLFTKKQTKQQNAIKEKCANLIFYMQLTKDYTIKIGD